MEIRIVPTDVVRRWEEEVGVKGILDYRPFTHALAAVVEDEYVGMITFVDGDSPMIVGVLVHPSHLRKGIGTRLFREAMSRLKGMVKVEVCWGGINFTDSLLDEFGSRLIIRDLD